jgi:hypothetical protein
VCIEAVGNPSVYRQAFEARDLGGTVVLVGVPTPDMTLELPYLDVFGRGGALKSSWYGDCLPERDFPMLIDLYQQGRLDLDGFVSETIGLDEVEEARENVFFEKLRRTLEEAKYRRQDRMVDRLLEQGYASTDVIAALVHLIQPEAAPERPASAAARPSAEGSSEGHARHTKPKFERERVPANEPRTGREPGMTPIFLNVGRKNLVTPADIVGKIAGVTRLPADIVGAIDILQRHTLVDVADPAVDRVLEKLAGVRIKGETLKPTRATGKESRE